MVQAESPRFNSGFILTTREAGTADDESIASTIPIIIPTELSENVNSKLNIYINLCVYINIIDIINNNSNIVAATTEVNTHDSQRNQV
jgi:hypothetical protein